MFSRVVESALTQRERRSVRSNNKLARFAPRGARPTPKAITLSIGFPLHFQGFSGIVPCVQTAAQRDRLRGDGRDREGTPIGRDRQAPPGGRNGGGDLELRVEIWGQTLTSYHILRA